MIENIFNLKFLKRIHFLKNIYIHFVNVETDPSLQ
jgi:hypothetical protein